MSSRGFGRDILSVLSSNISGIIIGFAAGILLSRLLGPDGRGIYATILVVPGIFASFAMLGSKQSTIFHVGRKTFSEQETLSALFVIFLATSVLAMLVSVVAFYVMDNIDLKILFIVTAILTIPARLMIIYSSGFFIGQEKFYYSNILRWLPELLNLVFIVLLVWIMHRNVEGALIAFLLSNLITGLYGVFSLRKTIPMRLKVDMKIIKSIVKLGLVYAVALFVMQLNYRVDILILGHYKGKVEVGLYNLGVAFAMQLWQIPNAIAIVVKTRVANTENPKDLKYVISRLIRLSVIVCVVLSIALYFISPWIIPFIYGKDFYGSVVMMQAILPGIMLFVIFRIVSGSIAGIGRPDVIIKIFIPALIINIALNYVLIPLYGGIGAAWATNVSYSLGAIATLWVFSVKMNLPLWQIFRYEKKDFIFKRHASN